MAKHGNQAVPATYTGKAFAATGTPYRCRSASGNNAQWWATLQAAMAQLGNTLPASTVAALTGTGAGQVPPQFWGYMVRCGALAVAK
jgi:hypothetical protein